MAARCATWAAALLAALLVAACDGGQEAADPAALGASGDPTTALGAARPSAAEEAPPPPPPMARGASAEVVRTSPDSALAAWIQAGQPTVAAWTAAGGWSAPLPLETLYGEASQVQLASNGQGAAMAIWRHTIGSIEALRFSRWGADTGWSVPDVMPGALPRPFGTGQHGPELEMDAAGNAYAHWPSALAEGATQSARHVQGQGWTQALGEPLAAAGEPPGAHPAPAPAASPR